MATQEPDTSNPPIESAFQKIESFGQGRLADLNVVFGISQDFLRPMSTTVASIASNNPLLVIGVHLLIDSLSDESREKLRALAGIHANIEISAYLVEPSYFADLPSRMRYPAQIYYRLLGPYLEPGLDRLLYLDADILCLRSLQPLLDLDLAANTAAAVPDLEETNDYRTKLLSLKPGSYFNSGV